MALCLLLLVSALFCVGQSQPSSYANNTDLQAAIGDMRKFSFHGFVILLKILNSASDVVRDREITFFMPEDEQLSKASLTQEHLHDFILSHSIQTAMPLSHLQHLPNQTLIPSNVPNRMLRITNSRKSGIFVNNARIVTPNVCMSTVVRCHGVGAIIRFGGNEAPPLELKVLKPNLTNSEDTKKRSPNSSPSHVKKTPALQ